VGKIQIWPQDGGVAEPKIALYKFTKTLEGDRSHRTKVTLKGGGKNRGIQQLDGKKEKGGLQEDEKKHRNLSDSQAKEGWMDQVSRSLTFTHTTKTRHVR